MSDTNSECSENSECSDECITIQNPCECGTHTKLKSGFCYIAIQVASECFKPYTDKPISSPIKFGYYMGILIKWFAMPGKMVWDEYIKPVIIGEKIWGNMDNVIWDRIDYEAQYDDDSLHFFTKALELCRRMKDEDLPLLKQVQLGFNIGQLVESLGWRDSEWFGLWKTGTGESVENTPEAWDAVIAYIEKNLLEKDSTKEEQIQDL